MITAYGKVEDAVHALKIGAFDFVSKPVDLSILRKLVNTALKLRDEESQRTDTSAADDSPFVKDGLDKLTGNSEAIQKCKTMIKKLARSQAPILVSGESGSGKELAARLIHDLGPRADQPFVPVNCGAIPTELMESEFFGHLKGSFTGAATDKEGLFQAADGGTLMLDEVADLPLHMQVKLLRAIQEKAVLPIGARQEVPVDVRIVSASHQTLRPLVESGKFRSDLFFRLNVIELPMPSLMERRDDIELLHDMHERVEPMDAIDLIKRLEEFRPFFIEDPFSPENMRWFPMLREQCAVPIAMGELLNNPHEWVDPMAKRWYDFIRIHISQIGGITPAMKVARLGEWFNVRTAWHGPGDTSPVGHAANAHIDLAVWNFGIQIALWH